MSKQKPIISVSLNLPELRKYIKYHDWNEARVYLREFIDNCMLVVHTAEEQGEVLEDDFKINDSTCIR